MTPSPLWVPSTPQEYERQMSNDDKMAAILYRHFWGFFLPRIHFPITLFVFCLFKVNFTITPSLYLSFSDY